VTNSFSTLGLLTAQLFHLLKDYAAALMTFLALQSLRLVIPSLATRLNVLLVTVPFRLSPSCLASPLSLLTNTLLTLLIANLPDTNSPRNGVDGDDPEEITADYLDISLASNVLSITGTSEDLVKSVAHWLFLLHRQWFLSLFISVVSNL
jgi:hypothetical protein